MLNLRLGQKKQPVAATEWLSQDLSLGLSVLKAQSLFMASFSLAKGNSGRAEVHYVSEPQACTAGHHRCLL